MNRASGTMSIAEVWRKHFPKLELPSDFFYGQVILSSDFVFMSATNYDVVAIGNALVDIQVQVDDELLQKFSLPKGAMTLSSAQEQAELLKKINTLPQEISSGGSAANTVHGLGRFGAKAYHIGKVAQDKYGTHYQQDMQKCGVGFSLANKTSLTKSETELAQTPNAQQSSSFTGTCLVFITPDAQRTMLTHLGASAFLTPNDVNEDIIRTAKYLYIEGYLFTQEPTRSAALQAARIAKENGVAVAFTLSDTFVIENFYDDIKSFIENYTDILFCNEAEGLTLSQSSQAEKAFAEVSSLSDTLFFTRSEKPAWLKNSVSDKIEVPSFAVQAVDTTGAGDLFAAGVLWGLLQKRNLRDCGILGNYCASQVITHLRARLPADSVKETDTILSLYQAQKKN